MKPSCSRDRVPAPRFAGAIVEARTTAGFETGYKFYHRNGGRRHFPFTYAYYLRFERGTALPRPQWLPRIVTALRIVLGEETHRALMRAYLVDLLGGEENFGLVASGLAPRDPAAKPRPGQEALRWMRVHHCIHLTEAQFQALAADEAAYWCSEALLNDARPWSAAELAEALGLAPAAVGPALERLKDAGVAVRAPGGLFRGRWAGKLYTFPGRLSGMEGCLKRIQGFWERMRRRRGGDFAERFELVRAEEDAMRRYWTELGDVVDGSNAYSVQRRGKSTGLFLVEARIRKLTPF